jgi:hypothetical protein
VTLTPASKVAALVVPWLFLAVFASLYILVLVPRVRDGAWLAICVGAFVALVFLSFLVAAVTFSRDVLTGRWPSISEE